METVNLEHIIGFLIPVAEKQLWLRNWLRCSICLHQLSDHCVLREIALQQKKGLYSSHNHIGMSRKAYRRAKGLSGQMKCCENSPAKPETNLESFCMWNGCSLLSWSSVVHVKAVSTQALLLIDPFFKLVQGHHIYLPAWPRTRAAPRSL